jgi:hypothetical protein
MLKFAGNGWIAGVCCMGAVLSVFGCSSSKPYTLVAQVPSTSEQSPVLAATIDVANGSCSVRILTLDSLKAWTPLCFVRKDQSTYKSLLIANQTVDFGAVGNGFQVISTTLPSLPAPPNHSSGPKPGPGSSTASTMQAAAPGPGFPSTWSQSPYPGHVVLQGQDTGYIVTKAELTINGSQGTLDVSYKTGYKPLHLECIVTANQHGDFTLMFNPAELLKITPSANYQITLSSEGSGIAGNIWDSRGFDTWQPSLPPQWVAVSYSSN